MTRSKFSAYIRLMRLDKPIGTFLLLWPTLWALFLATGKMPNLAILIIFIAGVIVMRAAGCVINDYADRHVDGRVKRTALRPLATNEMTESEAKILFIVLSLIAFILVNQLNSLTVLLSLVAISLAFCYPFMKRYTHLPQFVLGAAFGWSIPMAFAATTHHLPIVCWVLFLANLCWTVAYDTQYAMVDRDDDLKIGIKSTAILFGRHDVLIISILQSMTIILLFVVGHLLQLSIIYYIGIGLTSLFFIYQFNLIKLRQRENCFRAFLNNNWVGGAIFFSILLSLAI